MGNAHMWAGHMPACCDGDGGSRPAAPWAALVTEGSSRLHIRHTPSSPSAALPAAPCPRSVDSGSPISLIAGACALSAPGAKCKMWRLTEEACPFVKSVVYT